MAAIHKMLMRRSILDRIYASPGNYMPAIELQFATFILVKTTLNYMHKYDILFPKIVKITLLATSQPYWVAWTYSASKNINTWPQISIMDTYSTCIDAFILSMLANHSFIYALAHL